MRGMKGIVLGTVMGLALAAGSAHALKIATWNIHDYDTAAGNVAPITPRQGDFQVVLAAIDPDVLIVEELNTAAAQDSFFLDVLGVIQPGQWQTSAYLAATGSGVFWKSARVAVSNVGAFADGGPRDVLQCLVKPVGYASNAAWFRLYAIHLKAGGPATPDSATRTTECTTIRNVLNGVNVTNVGPNFVLGGDTNFYGAYETGYTRLTESQADNDGRHKDVLNMPGNWHVNSSYALFDTQCPCLNCPYSSFSGGGMDDRFDILFSSYSLQDAQGLDVVDYLAWGNDGAHFNDDIDGGGFNYAVGFGLANALRYASDHIPVLMTLQLPAKLSTASQLAFGSVIVGATAQQSLAISDIAPLPGDTLRYAFNPPAGYSAPAGTLLQAAGAAPTGQLVTLDTSAEGVHNATLTITSNDPDSASKSVKLSGKVLRHAAASLDSNEVLLADTLDFGDRARSAFADSAVRLVNFGFDGLQAKLALASATLSGGGGRFSLPGGFTPSLVGTQPATVALRFDPTGMPADSVCYGTLTVASADDALPGGQPQPDLVVTLRAKVVAGTDAVPGGPLALRFEAPRPNPAPGPVRLAFALPQGAPVTLEVMDLSGRRVATLASGTFGAGRHELTWDPRATRGRAAAGLYFVRFSTTGYARTTRLVLLP